MKRESIVTLRIIWDDEFRDSPTTWAWEYVEGLNDSDGSLKTEIIPHPSGGDVSESVEAAEIVRFDEHMMAPTWMFSK